MARRDPNKTARNLRVAAIKEQRRELQPHVFNELSDFESGRYCNEESLNAFIGSKAANYLNLHDEVIKTHIEYQDLWLKGLMDRVKKGSHYLDHSAHGRMHRLVKGNYPKFKQYLSLFLEGSFLKHYDEFYKKRPKISESSYWFGNNNDEFGLLVTPRFRNGSWENDKSEVRHFQCPYWTIAHVLNTGLVYMKEEKIREFSSTEDYLNFFRDMVRRTASKYQLYIADRYIEYVKLQTDQDSVPLLLPELRYDPFKSKHKYRLDYLIINPWSMQKFGFEMSPWSSHGKLKGKDKKLQEYNEDAKSQFEKEMTKHKDYWRTYGITYVTYTDKDLADLEHIWNEVQQHLEVRQEPEQLNMVWLDLLNKYTI